MELIEKVIKAISPKVAAHRQYWLNRTSRLYDAAANNIYHKRPVAAGSGNQSMDQARTRIRDWARHLDENHDLAIGVLDELVNKVVGVGITLEPLAGTRGGKPNKKLNREITKLWNRWERRPEVTGQLPFSEVQRLAARAWFRDGEILNQHVLGPRGGLVHLGGVPYSIELIEADFLPFELIEPARGIIHGVEADQWGRPRAFHLLRDPPNTRVNHLLTPRPGDTRRVPAEIMSHVKFTRRFNQVRGVSIFHGVSHRLDDIKDYEESERITARVGASMSAFIKKGTDFDPTSSGDSGDIYREMEFTPGMIFDDLVAGEDIGTIDTNRPNSNLQDFRNSQLRAIASGTGTSYSSISKDYSGNYSSQRQELVESWPSYDRLRAYFISAFMQPIYSNFITAAVLSGALKVPGSIDLVTLSEAQWIAPPKSWIDPKKEIEADKLAVDNRFKTRASVIRERTGREPDIVKEQILLELADDPPVAAPAAAGPGPGPAQPAAPEADDDDDASEAA